MAAIRGRYTQNFIDGRWCPPESGRSRPNINPADISDHIGDFAGSGGLDVDNAVAAATEALSAWKALGPIERAEYLRTAERLIEERAEDFAVAINREQGKLLKEARGEVKRALAIISFTSGE